MIGIRLVIDDDDDDDDDAGADSGHSTSSRLASLGQLMKYGTTKSVVRASSLQNHGFGQARLSLSVSLCLCVCLALYVCLAVSVFLSLFSLLQLRESCDASLVYSECKWKTWSRCEIHSG